MESKGAEVTRKRFKPAVEENEGGRKFVEKVEFATEIARSEEMDLNHILEKIENFTELVSELLESGKAMLKQLSNEFEERMIMIHKEQIEKWQEEIKELKLLDASNVQSHAVLHDARCLLQNAHIDY
ncbi:uncharacterized protein LOC107426195 [Ziziphus jujuba]|nr:uncharacterized protein LOC107426195 [Ziziphus jujuba]XP_015891793.1 uncharacterized protein LOC107426195 [Ziziphus jujuba]